MKFYLASRFEDRERMRAARRNLIDLGHTVQAQWIDLEPDVPMCVSTTTRPRCVTCRTWQRETR